jgi:NADH-quinone oxidoreductase subunit J
MNLVCYGSCAVALLSALLVIVERNAMRALLHLIVMLLALGLAFFALGAPFVAALQVVIYAGAIMVLFVFVVMMLNLGAPGERQEQRWLGAGVWGLPVALTLALLALCAYALLGAGPAGAPAGVVSPKQVGLVLYRDYLLVVEIASLLLVAGLVAAVHLAPPARPEPAEPATLSSSEARSDG